MTPEERLAAMGITLPKAPAAVANYIPCVRTGNLVMTAGQLPFSDGEILHPGKVGGNVTVEQGAEATRVAVINGLAQIKSLVSDLSQVTRVVRIEGFVQSATGFQQQSSVMNGASDFLVEVFGELGRHTRTAIGVSELPLNAACQISLFVEVKD